MTIQRKIAGERQNEKKTLNAKPLLPDEKTDIVKK